MDFEMMTLIGQYLMDKDKKEWSEYIMELIKIHQQMYSTDEDYNYSESEGSAEEEDCTYTTEDEQGFLSLA
mgnify:CR=1 FL=1